MRLRYEICVTLINNGLCLCRFHDGSSGTSDPYCIVKVDNEVVARTATVWKNLNPFWGEEYTLHLPMGFHSLSFYVMDEDTIGHDDVIGKISLNKEAIGSQGKAANAVGMLYLHEVLKPIVNRIFDEKKYIELDPLSEVHQRAVFLPSVTVKEGYLHKRKAEGPQLLTRFAFKKRYFWLSSETLSYAKSPDWQVRSSIPVQRICAVERVDENAFQQQNMMQVVTQDNDGQLHTMYILCKNVNALNQWLSSIRKASIYNERMLPSFHPGAYRSGKWSCCLQSDRTGSSFKKWGPFYANRVRLSVSLYRVNTNVNALNQWLSSIRKASIYNERMLPSFHPGAYRSGKWSCCLQSDRTVLGCSRTHSAVTLGDWSDPLDPDAETQTIYRQLLQGRDKLRKKYLESADAETAMDQEERKHSPRIRSDGVERSRNFHEQRMAAAARLLDVVQDLERAHQAFERREKEEAANEILPP
ncbi:UNVERIFIED_CONTAM: hypothetical protein FKN15_028629 [Acipenser sinensis]